MLCVLLYRLLANKESKYNDTIDELKEMMLELEVMLLVSFSYTYEQIRNCIIMLVDKT